LDEGLTTPHPTQKLLVVTESENRGFFLGESRHKVNQMQPCGVICRINVLLWKGYHRAAKTTDENSIAKVAISGEIHPKIPKSIDFGENSCYKRGLHFCEVFCPVVGEINGGECSFISLSYLLSGGARTMTEVASAEHRTRLLEERADIMHNIENLREDVKDLELEFEADEGDPELTEREKNLVLLATFEQRLEEIDLALEKLNLGSNYGICQNCGQPIDPERLKIVPEAQYCVPCKTKLERRKRR
jgi:DnaK suppressor protein